jgi:hypothetical protein
MIETFFARASSSARLLEPPLGSYLESLAQTLQGQRYSREVILSYVHAAHRFGEWLSKQGLPLSAVSETTDQPLHRSVPQTHHAGSPLWPAIEAFPRTGSPACCIAASGRRCRNKTDPIVHGTMAGSV